MDFLDPKKRKQHRIKLFIGYGLVAIALAFAIMVMLYQVNGLRRDPRTGDIIQNGFIFIDSQPSGADIILNGESKGRTNQRLDVSEGEYSLELRLSGYRGWKRDFVLEGGKIERYSYPFLFPEQLETADVQLYAATPGLITESLDRRWLLSQQPGSFQNFDLLDMNSEAVTAATFSLPAGLMTPTGAAHSLQLIEWSSDNEHVVLKHNFEGGHEFVVINIVSPGASINLSRIINVPFTDLALRDKKFDQYYLYNEPTQTLQTASVNNPVPAAYLSDVLAFKPHGNDVMAYITAAGAAEGKVLIRAREGQDSFTLREIAAGNKYLIDVARFDNSWYYAAGTAEDQRTYIFKNPVAAVKRAADRRPVPVAVLRTTSPASFLSFSTIARFIAVQAGDEFSVYDAETDRQYRYDTDLGLKPEQKATWMDGHRLSLAVGNKAVVFDFDGTNRQTLSNALDGFPVLFDRDYEAMYTLAPSVVPGLEARPAIVRTSLRVEP